MSGVRLSHLSAFGMTTKPFGRLRINQAGLVLGGSQSIIKIALYTNLDYSVLYKKGYTLSRESVTQ